MAANSRSKSSSRSVAAKTVSTKDKRDAAHPAEQNAVSFLSGQHREVEKLFKRFEELGEDGPEDEKELLVREACAKLTVHATIEEEIFYPAAREVEALHALLNEAEVEHGTAKDLIAKLDAMDADDEMFDANFTVLSEYIKHHVKEEEGELFPKVKKSELDLDELGQELAERADELAGAAEPA